MGIRFEPVLASALAIIVGPGVASAGLTPIFDSVIPEEPNHVEIFEELYGPGFSPAWAPPGAPSYTNGPVTVTRVDDFGVGGFLNMVFGGPGTADDQIWTDGIATISAEARFAHFDQEFGFAHVPPGLGGDYTKLFDVTGSGFDVSGSATFEFSPGDTWVWARADDSDGGTLENVWYSMDGMNRDGLDHMVTYQVTGRDVDATVWLLMWADENDAAGDWDFNDLVLEIHAVVIPTPGSLALLAVGGGLLTRRRRR